MTIHCVACQRPIQVPDERAANPRLKVKCGCGALFLLGEAAVAAPTQPVSAAPRPAPVAAPSPPRPPAPPAPRAAAAPPVPPPAPKAPPVPQVPPSRLSFQATAAVGADAGPSTARGAWRRCGTHAQAKSVSVCPQCLTGFCTECLHKVGVSVVCQKCEVICVAATDYEEQLRRERQRARPMMDELGTIIGYPLNDPVAYAMLAVFTWVFTAAGNLTVLYGKFVAVLFAQGVLMAYCFSALVRVSNGNMKDFMPEIGDITDLISTLRLGGTALLAGSGPLLLVMIAIPGVAIMGGMVPAPHPQSAMVSPPPMPPMMGPDGPMERPADGPVDVQPVSADAPAQPDAAAGLKLVGLALSALLFGGLALLWKIVYTPAALTVAGISRSAWSTLNPAVGVDTIQRMGGVYWQAMGIYTVIAAAEWLIGAILGFIPFLGGFVRAFVDAYAYLMIGCVLGLAVFKKAPELGLE